MLQKKKRSILFCGILVLLLGQSTAQDYPTFRYRVWSSLTADTKEAAGSLGYTQYTWDNPGSAAIEKNTWSQMEDMGMRQYARTIGFFLHSWECYVNHYLSYTWDELKDVRTKSGGNVIEYYETLGWTSSNWLPSNNPPPSSEQKYWDTLTEAEKNAGRNVCYFKESWNLQFSIEQWPPYTAPTNAPNPNPPTNAPNPNPPTNVPTTNSPTKAQTPTGTPSANPTLTSDINYYDEPKDKWTYSPLDIGPTSLLNKGNAVTVSPEDGNVYATYTNGRIEVLRAQNAFQLWNYTAPSGANGTAMRCASGVSFAHSEDHGHFAVYAVIDESDDDALTESRIIAVNKNGGLIFVSPPIPGVAVGTPIVTKGYQPGKFIFVTHNVGTEGHFSVLSVFKNGNIIFTEAAGNNNTEDAVTYGPLGVSHNPDYGKYTGGSDTDSNTNDIVTWTTSAEEGFGSPGYTMAFQLPKNFDLAVLDFVVLETVRLKSVSWNAIAKPTLSMDGLSMYIPVQASETRGWVGGRQFDKGASWSTKLESNTDRGNTPISSAMVLSVEEYRVFVGAASPFFYGLDSTTGRVLWFKESEEKDVFEVEAKVSPDDMRVYAIDSGGTIYSYDQVNGEKFWSFKSDGVSMLADFDVSENGLVLYYGDQLGRISAIEVGSSITGTLAPSSKIVATTSAPTPAPIADVSNGLSSSPSNAPSMASVSSGMPSGVPTVVKSVSSSPSKSPVDVPTGNPSSGAATPLFNMAFAAVLFGATIFLK